MIDPAEITARLNAATPGLWRFELYSPEVTLETGERAWVEADKGTMNVIDVGDFITIADAEFIAHAPTDIAFLLSRVAVLEAQKQAAQADAWDAGGKARTDWLWSMNDINPRQASYVAPPVNPFRALGGEETT